jgi:hypothetical protein
MFRCVTGLSNVRGSSIDHIDEQRVRKNDEECNNLVDRINSVIDLLRDETQGRSKVSSRQIEKLCQSFYEYVLGTVRTFTLITPPPVTETSRNSSSP